jgi:hypothetical protein
MLPDYPGVKRELSTRLDAFLKERVDFHLGPLRRIRRIKLFEGDSQMLTRASGEQESTEFKEVRAGFSIRVDEFPTLTLASLLERFDQVAQDVARQTAENLYSTVSRAVERVGNVVDAKGERFSAELILETLSTMQIDFDSDGTPHLPELHIHPSLAEAAKLAEEEVKGNRELRRQFARIIEEKREEWRAREASRRLVG